jgi:diadenosine tetraphosphate (Ap4A) HIT family hydrolase
MGIKNFFELPADKTIGGTEHFFLIYDGFAVSPGHVLIISKLLQEDYFALSVAEKADLHNAVSLAKKLIEEAHSPDGYNIGINCGAAAGQTVLHFHSHVIPRYAGGMNSPRGGVRDVIPNKGKY